MAELKTILDSLLKCVILINVHWCSDGDTRPTDELHGEFRKTLTEQQGLICKFTERDIYRGTQADFDIHMKPHRHI